MEIPWQRRKGDRTDAINGDLYGDPDTYRVAGIGTTDWSRSGSPRSGSAPSVTSG